MNNTRDKIKDYLHEHGHARASELAGVFGMTIANLRHHLGILIKDGAIEMVGPDGPPRRGRPAHAYRLSTRSMPHNLDQLVLALLTQSLAGLSTDEKEQSMVRLARQLLTNLAVAAGLTAGPGQLSRKLTYAVQVLNQMAYQARWEARSRAPILCFNHCPYLPVIANHPELCHLDRHMLFILTGLPAYQLSRIGSARSCQFSIGLDPDQKPI